MSENTVDRKDLKILAYQEKLSHLEDSYTDLRVEVTVLSHELQAAYAKLAEYEGQVEDAEASEEG